MLLEKVVDAIMSVCNNDRDADNSDLAWQVAWQGLATSPQKRRASSRPWALIIEAHAGDDHEVAFRLLDGDAKAAHVATAIALAAAPNGEADLKLTVLAP